MVTLPIFGYFIDQLLYKIGLILYIRVKWENGEKNSYEGDGYIK